QGVFEHAEALWFGRARGYSAAEHEQLYPLLVAVVRGAGGGLPIVANRDFGHTDPHWVLPLGVEVETDTEARTLTWCESATACAAGCCSEVGPSPSRLACWPYPRGVSIAELSDLRARGAAQQPTYADTEAVERAVNRLREMPPLVFAGECDNLRDKLAAVADGKSFLLQGGDCAETFDGVTAENVRNKLR